MLKCVVFYNSFELNLFTNSLKLEFYFSMSLPMYVVVILFICAGDVIMSLFLNELYGFQLDNHRW